MDFVEEDKEEGSPAIKKQVTLDEFLSRGDFFIRKYFSLAFGAL